MAHGAWVTAKGERRGWSTAGDPPRQRSSLARAATVRTALVWPEHQYADLPATTGAVNASKVTHVTSERAMHGMSVALIVGKIGQDKAGSSVTSDRSRARPCRVSRHELSSLPHPVGDGASPSHRSASR